MTIKEIVHLVTKKTFYPNFEFYDLKIKYVSERQQTQ